MWSRVLNAILGHSQQGNAHLPLEGRSRTRLVLDGDGAALAVADAHPSGEFSSVAVRMIPGRAEAPVPARARQEVRNAAVPLADRQKLLLFRALAEDARRAALLVRGQSFPLAMKNGYVEPSGIDRHVQSLCIPVRRAYADNDPVSFRRMVDILRRIDAPELRDRVDAIVTKYHAILSELRTPCILNDQRITFDRFLGTWFEAAVYMDFADKRARFDGIVNEFGKAVEGIVLHATHQMADCIVDLDAVIADLLGEPHLPPASTSRQGAS